MAVGVKDPYTCAKLGMTLIYFEAFSFSFTFFIEVFPSVVSNIKSRRRPESSVRGYGNCIYLFSCLSEKFKKQSFSVCKLGKFKYSMIGSGQGKLPGDPATYGVSPNAAVSYLQSY